jgi:hypothetical protein
VKTLDEFLLRFVTPLVAGGDVHVGEPVPPRLFDRWEVELGEAAPALEAIDAARAALASSLVVRPPPLVFGGEELRLSAALHGALTLAHPGTSGLGTRRGRRELAAWSLDLTRVAPATTPAVALARHTLLGRLFELTRHDTQVKWWTGKADFRGAAPPARLLRWRRLRRVREESAEVQGREGLSPAPFQVGRSGHRQPRHGPGRPLPAAPDPR